ncbi:hypothetical protein HY214_00745 [Candidatus Roizmanbacteria bacterium]|nr:hypothetical protein [Candidatus Roizmanbacteria bacterium]
MQPLVYFYSGTKKKEGYSGVISERNLFLVVEWEGSISQDEGEAIIQIIKEKLTDSYWESLAQFESFIISVVGKENIPLQFSLAVVYWKGTVLYLITRGNGAVFIRRQSRYAKLLSENNIASGHLKEGDFFLLTTSDSLEKIGGLENIKKIIQSRSPTMIGQTVREYFMDHTDEGVGMIMIEFLTVRETPPLSSFAVRKHLAVPVVLSSLYQNLRQRSQAAGRPRLLTSLLVGALTVILVWSVLLGYQRRLETAAKKQIQETAKLIHSELEQADEASFVNMERALIFISQAKTDLVKLKKDVGNQRKKEVASLARLIDQSEAKISRKEEKSFEEFYDLKLNDKNAAGSAMTIDQDMAAILDGLSGKIYLLSLVKKSVTTLSGSSLKSASLVEINQSEAYVMIPGSGIFKNIDQSFKKIIEPDQEWGKIRAIKIYNTNLYLLDTAKNDVYKYLPIENGYADKKSYFGQGEAPNTEDANSLAIDGSLYLGYPSQIRKYTGGVRDTFSNSLPVGARLNKIITAKESESLYAWDKGRGSVYILKKNGEYEREIRSDILQQSDDLGIFDNKIFVLAHNKIFKISL